MKHSDVIIIGSGIAALQLAVQLSSSLNVIVLTKSKLKDGNSYLAQGGMAVALSSDDSPYKHYIDTIEAGSHHHDAEAVLKMTMEAPDLLKELQNKGCIFDTDDHGSLLLGLEGAHSERRIVHCGGDATGKGLVDFLVSKLSHNVTIIEDAFAYELLLSKDERECIGVKATINNSTEFFYGAHVVLATGGCGQLFEFSSNSPQVTGDGLALAYLAGAQLVDMEFIQFHPTLLFIEGQTKGLISEAVRGEGATLVDENGDLIMKGLHPQRDLAPRHIVSQAIFEALQSGRKVYLDIKDIHDFQRKFPTITKLCEKAEIRLEDGLIPVAPGSHFLMGGVMVDDVGRSSLEGLYAIGEVACAGIHGANRLASNSLLEGLYSGRKLARWINSQPRKILFRPAKIKNTKPHLPIVLPDIEDIQKMMMRNAGIVRSGEGLQRLIKWLESYQVDDLIKMNMDFLTEEERMRLFSVLVARMIATSALQRDESRGGHFRSDFPLEDNLSWKNNKIVLKMFNEGEKHDEYIETALIN